MSSHEPARPKSAFSNPPPPLREDVVVLIEEFEQANYKPEFQFVVRQYAIGKGHSVSVLRRGGEVDTIFGFEKEADALEWIRTKSQGWLQEQRASVKN